MEQQYITSQGMVTVLCRTLNRIDRRLMDHGSRVAYLSYRFLKALGIRQKQELQRAVILAILHDIGAYKTEEISRMVEFESHNVWDHSIFGYLLLNYFSPFYDIAPAVLFHHTDWELLKKAPGLTPYCLDLAQIINLADRIDMFYQSEAGPQDKLRRQLEKGRGRKYGSRYLDLLPAALPVDWQPADLASDKEYAALLEQDIFDERDIFKLLELLVFTIDFRSYYTVTHTITTTAISRELARLDGLSPKELRRIHYGAMMHDLGKIAIPLRILESPGRLSPEEMAVMRTHVELTGKILEGCVDPQVMEIALRHHEKLDGSGYPRGLGAAELTESQRIVAIADILSALTGTRSYKEAYSYDKTKGIIQAMAREGKLDARLTTLTLGHMPEIMAIVREQCRPILENYRKIQKEYAQLSLAFADGNLYCPVLGMWRPLAASKL